MKAFYTTPAKRTKEEQKEFHKLTSLQSRWRLLLRDYWSSPVRRAYEQQRLAKGVDSSRG